MRLSLIIAAGGSGRRFRQGRQQESQKLDKKLRKQGLSSKAFAPFLGKPLFFNALDTFIESGLIAEIVIAAPRENCGTIRKFLNERKYKHVCVVAGGGTRAESVWKAFQRCRKKPNWLMVHDAARPFVQKQALKRLMQATRSADAAILGASVSSTMKQTDAAGRIQKTIDRSQLFEAETPQLVRADLFRKAYRSKKTAFQATDESQLIESVGGRVQAVEAGYWNPKITTYQDYELALAFAESQIPGLYRVGLGRDLHRFVTGRKLILGGLRIPSPKGSLGHSDGDVLLHAIADAILGALGRGDIGDWFSDKDPKSKNIDSKVILESVLTEMKKKNYSLKQIDTVIWLEKPKLGSYKNRIKAHLSKLLDLPLSAVSVKAKTMEGLEAIGRGEALASDAMVLLERGGN